MEGTITLYAGRDEVTNERIDTCPHLALKLAKIMGRVKDLKKDGRNEFHKYDYISIAETTRALAPLIAEENLAILPAVVGIEQRDNKSLIYCVFTIVDGDSGEWAALPWVAEGEDKGDKGPTKAIRNATKYFLMTLFMTSAEDEQESDGSGDPGQGGSQQPSRKTRTSSGSKKQAAGGGIRKGGGDPKDPSTLRNLLRARAGWQEKNGSFVKDQSKGDPISDQTQQHIKATLVLALDFEGAANQDIADNAKVVLEWLFGVKATDQLTEQEGQAIKYAWLKGDGILNEYAKNEAAACLGEAIETMFD